MGASQGTKPARAHRFGHLHVLEPILKRYRECHAQGGAAAAFPGGVEVGGAASFGSPIASPVGGGPRSASGPGRPGAGLGDALLEKSLDRSMAERYARARIS